jgi:hypothetical protein
MSDNWKITAKFLIRTIIIVAILMAIAEIFSTSVSVVSLTVTSLIGLWVKRKQLPSVVRRSRVIISIVFGTAVFFGFVLWYANKDTGSALLLISIAAAAIILSLGYYDDGIRSSEQEGNLGGLAVQVENIAIPIEEQQKCPHCEAIISWNAEKCSWCGENV